MIMEIPENRFKQRLKAGEAQTGLWCSLSSTYAAEAVASAGFDWLMFDTEHSPADLETTLGLLQVAAGYDVSALVRPAINDPVLIKRFLDIGAQTLLIPQVQSAAEAEAAVRAMRYPPHGIRGVSGLTRATRFGRVRDYAVQAERELCLLVQVETRAALDALDEIATVDGVDGVFIGPADLAASFGHVGQPSHPEVVEALVRAIERLVSLGVPAGLLSGDPAVVRRCVDAGSTFTATGVDAGLLARGADALAAAAPRRA